MNPPFFRSDHEAMAYDTPRYRSSRDGWEEWKRAYIRLMEIALFWGVSE